MSKKIFILAIIAIFLMSCQTGKEDAKKFSEDYVKITDQLKEKRSKVTNRDDYVAFKVEREKEYETLLKKYEKSPSIEEIEILRSKVLLNLDKLDEAEKKIDAVLADKPENEIDAKMVKIKILIKREKADEAYTIFKDIESQVTDQDDLFDAYYFIGAGHSDIQVKKECGEKFLGAKEIPEKHVRNKVMVYLTLVMVAKLEGNLDKAKELLNEGIAAVDEKQKPILEKMLAQFDYFGKKAFPFTASVWVNSEPLELSKLEGQVVILSFWAPWCPSCRALTPDIIAMYNEFKDQGFTVIGITRLYGRYRDDEVDKGNVTKDEEIELIKKYVERKNMLYPIAIVEDTTVYDDYKIPGLPTLIFIDKKGIVNFTKIDSGNADFLKEKVKKLLEG